MSRAEEIESKLDSQAESGILTVKTASEAADSDPRLQLRSGFLTALLFDRLHQLFELVFRESDALIDDLTFWVHQIGSWNVLGGELSIRFSFRSPVMENKLIALALLAQALGVQNQAVAEFPAAGARNQFAVL